MKEYLSNRRQIWMTFAASLVLIAFSTLLFAAWFWYDLREGLGGVFKRLGDEGVLGILGVLFALLLFALGVFLLVRSIVLLAESAAAKRRIKRGGQYEKIRADFDSARSLLLDELRAGEEYLFVKRGADVAAYSEIESYLPKLEYAKVFDGDKMTGKNVIFRIRARKNGRKRTFIAVANFTPAAGYEENSVDKELAEINKVVSVLKEKNPKIVLENKAK
ncbi:MAG: hypothetical protein IKQ92_02910 [Clostridia bacterium]|nr:hypothetical protein [Clostridia bacterium]